MVLDTRVPRDESRPRARRRALTTPDLTAGTLSTGRALSQFALVGVLVLLLLGSTGLLALHHVAVDEEIEQAKELTLLATRTAVTPNVTSALLAGNQSAIDDFDEKMQREVLGRRVVTVKLWQPNGTIVYSNDRRQIGRHYVLAPRERQMIVGGGVDARLSDLDRKENSLDDKVDGRLLEVYTRVERPQGPLLFETYLKMDSVLAGSSRLVWSIVPAFMLALLALQVLQLPLAWRLVRRVQMGQKERAALQRRALEASDHERRRIARDLHDGLVQSLVGVSYSLAGTADRARAEGRSDTAEQLDEAADATRSGVAQLRSLITDIYPPSLEALGLRASIGDLLAVAEKRGLETSQDIAADPVVAPEVTAALFRAAQEAVRNVIAHSGATRLHVALITAPRTVGVVVTDDGIGPTAVPPDPTRAHFGLRMLADLATEVGGRLDLAAAPDGGSVFTFVLPSR
jgi:two-component system NarL family sensor kinase